MKVEEKAVDEQAWLTSTDPIPMLRYLGSQASTRKLQLFACHCCRRIWSLVKDTSVRNIIEVAERYADDGATIEDLREAVEGAEPSVLIEEKQYRDMSEDCGRTAVYNAGYVGCIPDDDTMGFALDAAAFAAAAKADGRPSSGRPLEDSVWLNTRNLEQTVQCCLIRDLFNPFNPVTLNPSCLTPPVLALAQAIYDHRSFDRLPELAQALEDAGCEDAELLAHLRSPGPHARGCFALDAVLGKS